MIFTSVKKIIRNRVILQCDATWSSHIYDKMKDYVDGKADSMATGFGIETGVEIEGYVSITDADEVLGLISNLHVHIIKRHTFFPVLGKSRLPG